ncbi:hypothetical protein K2173_011948 [Erythroxylum novogranatense]|uniref:Uncharacterized protein n=1 Tax=Erythroxylum novogranatense TaxID=1862640 RepID=A0AAV8UCH5_9ROSI|nr:hypothetical protein K2173_011948 [Erythroxylum novogranatense]
MQYLFSNLSEEEEEIDFEQDSKPQFNYASFFVTLGIEAVIELEVVLNAGKNKLKTIEELKSLVKLRALILNENEIASICGLDQMKELNTLGELRNEGGGEGEVKEHEDVDIESEVEMREMNIVKFSSNMGIDPKPFDHKTYVEEEAFVTDGSGAKRRLRLENNIVRWRRVRNPNGTTSIRPGLVLLRNRIDWEGKPAEQELAGQDTESEMGMAIGQPLAE